MLNIYHVVLGVLKELQPALRRIEVRDRDLARQLRRCSSSVALNLAEGMYSRGKNRGARYHNALGSARETLACMEVAVVCSYVQQDERLHDQLDRVVATLVKLVARIANPRMTLGKCDSVSSSVLRREFIAKIMSQMRQRNETRRPLRRTHQHRELSAKVPV